MDNHFVLGSFTMTLSLVPRLIVAFVVVAAHHVGAKLIEPERLLEYQKRGYQWPLSLEDFVPSNPGWMSLLQHRLSQVEALNTSGSRYNGFMSLSSSVRAKNFTELGFGLARAPSDLTTALRQGIFDGLATAQVEKDVEVILGERPLFIERRDLTARVLEEMQSYAEAWAGIPLKAFIAYGFRLYRNGSQLMMHTDRSQTHVISFILHIASSDDAEPWPIVIEDFLGRSHSVVLTPGDVLFYESSKCNHGRPIPFKGSWYTSVFVHYYPDDGEWENTKHDLENHYWVPPHWKNQAEPPPEKPILSMEGMSFREPNCPHDWCLLQSTANWTGPGEDGFWINPNQEKIPLILKPAIGVMSTLDTSDEADDENDEEKNYGMDEDDEKDEGKDEGWEEEL